jgi:hypothetical protein
VTIATLRHTHTLIRLKSVVRPHHHRRFQEQTSTLKMAALIQEHHEQIDQEECPWEDIETLTSNGISAVRSSN